MRAALPAAANAPIASSSVRGATYRISVMFVPVFPLFFIHCLISVFWLAGIAYTAGGDWNSLRPPVNLAVSYAETVLAGALS
jgi:hypothetical protein